MKDEDDQARVDGERRAAGWTGSTAFGNEAVPTDADDDGCPYDDEDNEYEEFDCHRGSDGSCGLAGTEECDWECPYNRR